MKQLQRRLSHKDNRDFKIWHKNAMHEQNYPVQKKEQYKTTYRLSEAIYEYSAEISVLHMSL